MFDRFRPQGGDIWAMSGMRGWLPMRRDNGAESRAGVGGALNLDSGRCPKASGKCEVRFSRRRPRHPEEFLPGRSLLPMAYVTRP